jgi:hypothetical protein
VGEANIANIEWLLPAEALEKYPERLFINNDEMMEYSHGRPAGKRLLVLTLEGVKKYSKPIKLEKPITMTGLTLDFHQYKHILKQ